MTKLIFAAAAIGLMALPALAQDQVEADLDAAAIVADCSAHKFETNVEVMKDGKKRNSKVKLCGKQGQSDSDWLVTLKDAATKVEANPKMAPAAKEQIVAALKVEIARLEASAGASPTASVEIAPVSEPAAMAEPVAPAIASAPPPPRPAAKKPKLTIKCLAPGEKGAGSSCLSLEHNTRLSIRADDSLDGNASLRFLRRGDARGQIALTGLRQGETRLSKLPPELCSGVRTSKVEIQVVGPGGVAETLGPYALRC